MSKISLKNVYKAYQKKEFVINNLSLEIFDDEFLILVGSSGCGKTTILRMIAGLEELTDGNLYIDGIRQNDKEPSSRKLSFVFQNYALLPKLNVYGNIAFGLLNLKLNKLETKKRVEEIAIKLSLFDKLTSYTYQLSGGERQRVALARAMVDDDSLVLFDEPLSNLDAILREQMRRDLLHMQKTHRMTAVYVTHDQIEAMAMASRIVLIDKGEILQVGTPYQMYNNPSYLGVMSFIGTNETNIFSFEYIKGSIVVNHNHININEDILKLIINKNIDKGYLSIRPEKLKVSHLKSNYSVLAKCLVVENYYEQKILHLEALGQKVRVIIDFDFNEKEDLYIDMSSEGLLFDQEEKRVFKSITPMISCCKYVFELIDEQVVNALHNYGYKLYIESDNPQLKYNSKNNNYILRLNNSVVILENLQDILKELDYIKNFR